MDHPHLPMEALEVRVDLPVGCHLEVASLWFRHWSYILAYCMGVTSDGSTCNTQSEEPSG